MNPKDSYVTLFAKSNLSTQELNIMNTMCARLKLRIDRDLNLITTQSIKDFLQLTDAQVQACAQQGKGLPRTGGEQASNSCAGTAPTGNGIIKSTSVFGMVGSDTWSYVTNTK